MRQPSLAPLLPWLNGSATPAQTRRRLGAFVRAFDGSPAAGHLRTHAAAAEAELHGGPVLPAGLPAAVGRAVGYERVEPVSDRALDALRRRVLSVVEKGFPYDPDGDPDQRLPKHLGERLEDIRSLRFGVLRRAAESHRLSRRDRRYYSTAPGAYVVMVDGSLRDLVPYLVLRLLTLPGAVRLARCPAPARGARDGERCGQLFLQPATGRPRKFCSNACKVRRWMHES